MARIYYSQILLFSLSIFSFLISQSKALTFNLAKIGPQHQNVYITPFKDSYISTRGLQVTSDEKNTNMQQRTGKATYIEPLHLWDKSTGSLADFYTHFTFVVDSDGHRNFADGLAFFLSPDGSNSTAGGAMGLPIDPVTIEPTSPFVAVEFDTYPNGWDPASTGPFTHVGINVNSLKSSVTSAWYCDITHGKENEAWIWYNSRSHRLSVVFTGYSDTDNTKVKSSIDFIVDLREYLPEWVTLGFSAATGAWFEKHTVTSWSFSSKLSSKEAKSVSVEKSVSVSVEKSVSVEESVSLGEWIIGILKNVKIYFSSILKTL